MFDFLTGIYCTLFGWILPSETCTNLQAKVNLERGSTGKDLDKESYFQGGKHKKTRKNLKHKHRKNKTQTNKYFIF